MDKGDPHEYYFNRIGIKHTEAAQAVIICYCEESFTSRQDKRLNAAISSKRIDISLEIPPRRSQGGVEIFSM